MSELRIIADSKIYVGSLCSEHESLGRARVTASCGHDVWLSDRGLAAKAEGKRVLCYPCAKSRAEEHGAGFGVISHEL